MFPASAARTETPSHKKDGSELRSAKLMPNMRARDRHMPSFPETVVRRAGIDADVLSDGRGCRLCPSIISDIIRHVI